MRFRTGIIEFSKEVLCPGFASRVSLPEFRFPSFASRVSLREHEVLFAALKRTKRIKSLSEKSIMACCRSYDKS